MGGLRRVQMGGLGVAMVCRNGWMGRLEEWVDGWTKGMGGLLVIIHDSIYG